MSYNTGTSNNLNKILKKYTHNKEHDKEITHTRIGNRDLNIYGGSYSIENDLSSNSIQCHEFYKEYFNNIINNSQDEYLTERQLIEDGPLLVDIDLRYNLDINTRQHNKEHIIDLITLYCEHLTQFYNVEDGELIKVYVLEKPNIVRKDKYVKDGIHLIFTISIHKAIQVLLRENIINKIQTMWDGLPISNQYDDVFDIGITKGFVNWQMYGSKKPECEAYKLVNLYNLTYSENDKYWNYKEIDINKIDIKNHFHLMSARYKYHKKLPIKDNKDIQDKIELSKKNLNIKSDTQKKTTTNENNNSSINIDFIDYNKINNQQQLDNIIEQVIDNNNNLQYEVKEIYKFLMILSVDYYSTGSYNKWIRVGWALKNTKLLFKLNNDILFIFWIKLSSKSEEFTYKDIPEYYSMWKSFDEYNPDGLTCRSIMYWAKNSDPVKYKSIRQDTISYFIEQTIFRPTECGLADVLYQLYKDEFVCVSVKNNNWYECKNGKWDEIDSGNTLRMLISKKMHDIYMFRAQDIIDQITRLETKGENTEPLRTRSQKLGDICTHLKTTSWKNNIMKEAKELFYDKEFINKLDANPYLLCFNNYLVDFKSKIYRTPKPDDYISKSTGIDYVPSKEFTKSTEKAKRYANSQDEINNFMSSLFPDKELKKYMWEHLASVLIGTNQNQSFNIYTGNGCNGKSKLVELMSRVLGDYKATVPIQLITQNRTNIGSTSPEIVQLMGVRYAVMQEPQKGDKINEGIMKEITGGDPIQGRALFKDTVTFVPQFKLVVCTNVLFDIKTNDDGTWRRIRVCDFVSKFVDKPYMMPEKFPRDNFPYQYEIDRNIDEKFINWAPVLASMLVDIAFKTSGYVSECKVVMAVSDKYREGQDYLTEFAKDKIVKREGGKIKKTEILEEFKNWYIIHYGRNSMPNGREITDYMDKVYGKCNRGKWLNVEVLYNDDDNDDIESD